MNLEKLTFRNIGPYGNIINEIDLVGGGLWLVTGKNGGGKSTFLNLPKALFYGKVDKLRKDEIANRFNKHGYISGTISLSPTDKCVIERGFSPSSLVVYKNGEDIGKAGLNDYQQFIDNEITQLSYNIFSNVISLSVNDFKSFISMTPNDKRHIIDKIFSMEIINKMYEYVKKDIKEIKYNIDLFNKEIQVLTQNTERAKIQLAALMEKNNENTEDKLKSILSTLKDIKPNVEKATIKLKEYSQKKNTILESLKTIQTSKHTSSSDIRVLKQKIELFNKDKCPTCETSFNDEKHIYLRDELNSKLSEETLKYNQIIDAEKSYNNVLTTVNDAINKLSSYINTCNNNIEKLKYQYKELQNTNKSSDFDGMKNIINENSTRIIDIEQIKTSRDIDYKYLTILESMYSGEGIKRKIMESYLPHLNSEVEITLQELNFPYTLQFDCDFEPIIEQLGIKLSPDTLSTGEKKRADLAVLISIIRMMKRKFPRLNMFMLDEVLSSIDADGILDIISFLQKTAKELNINIFIVNHTVLPIEYFDKKITINKVDNFSNLLIENIL